MGINKTIAGNGRSRPKPTSAVPAQAAPYGGSRLDRLKGVSDKRSGTSVDWRQVDAETILEAIVLVTDADDAITFGRTADGGAYALVLYSDNSRKRFYEHDAADIEECLREIVTVYRE